MSHLKDAAFRSEDLPNKGFECSICHEWHKDLPISYSVKVPGGVLAIPDSELERRVVFTLDQCIIDGQRYYLRGRVAVPVKGSENPFIWGVWVRVEEADFLRTNDMWKTEGREAESPYRGWLDTAIPLYGNTLNLAVFVKTQPVGRRPHFELLDSTHPLALEQREGISIERVKQIAEQFLHPTAS